ncbi:unnamed protein product [Kuraishia capsulata CBS 1993]|uniref:Uncharacterized protein n=1 Tax=Kuraishia capsulata CBS 1993 TaxID=1382522 RepID=W6MX37_9ASCO|nr:uncharacterized protein KUCA_T00004192001 [Kuraishia capsulata CBS 1993]CDK28210.1 unnamed protein product [Kuraishia capsulata CBS 1993]
MMSRDISRDVIRGLTILEMNHTEFSSSPIFDHASYQDKKLNYADTIFPCFSFLTGFSGRPVPFVKNLQTIGLGLCFNALPILVNGGRLRLPGVLQRHGLASIILSASPEKGYIFPVLSTATWFAISVFLAADPKDPFTKPEDTAQQRIDKPIFKDRIYSSSYDPEGLLGALMTAVTIWSGTWFSRQGFSLIEALACGSALLATGKLLSLASPKFLPVSKPLWSPTFTLMTSGYSICKCALVKASIPYLPVSLLRALGTVGKKSMEVYFFGEILDIALKYGGSKSIWVKAKSWLESRVGSTISEIIMILSSDVALAAFAFACSRYDWSIRLL